MLIFTPVDGLEPHNLIKLNRGEALFYAGDPVTHMYVVRAGEMRMLRHAIDGTTIAFPSARADHLFAEASLFAKNYHCDGIAERDCVVEPYLKADFLKALEKNPQAAFSYMDRLSHEVLKLRNQTELMRIKSATKRLLEFIKLSIPPEHNQFTLIQSWKSLASEIGLTHEALYRALATLQKNGRITRKGRHIVLNKI